MNINEHQKNILYALTFKKKAGFSELNIEKLTSDLFNYHLQVLISDSFVIKDNNEQYILTDKAKEFISSIDSKSGIIEKQSLIIATAVCIKEINGIPHYLIHKRTKEPSYGFYTFPQGKIKFGETQEHAVKRELKEETGLSGKSQLIQVVHKLIMEDDNTIYRDILFFIYKFTEIKGKLINTLEGENIWMTENQFKEIKNKFDDDLLSIQASQHNKLEYLSLQVLKNKI